MLLSEYAVVVLNGIQLAFVRTYKYLGTVMTCDNANDANMLRQIGICYARANGIINNFSMCSPVVKATLFRTFCSNMYCSQLWRDFRSGFIRQLIVGYNHSFRYIMNYPRNCSASGMFVFNNIPSFMELWRNYIYGFMQRLINSENSVVAATVSSCRLSSALWSVEALGVCIIIIFTAALSGFFYVTFICIFIFTVRVTDIGVCFNYFMYLCLHVS